MNVKKVVAYGFFFGFGMSVAAWGAYAAAYALWPKQACSSSDASTRAAKPSARDTVEVVGVEEHKSGGRVYFTGVVKNNGQTPARPSGIEVNMFKGDKFVDQYSTYVAGDIAPGESRYFKVMCECREAPVADYDSFKAQVVGGY